MDYQQPDLSVITVNYNGFHDTCEFIDSWAATVFSVSYEMIVIDNGSIIRKTKCFDFWERNVLFPKTKRSFFRTPTPSTLPFSA